MGRPPLPHDLYYVAQPEYIHVSDPNKSGINTLFVSGLPDDVMAREIHNLFRRRPGFESCQLKYTGRGNQVVAFATFVDHQSAMSALISLNGVKFDPQTGSTLHIELARSNSRRKNKPGSGPYVVIDNRKKSDVDAHESSSSDGDNDSDGAASNPDSGNQDYSAVAAEKSNEKTTEEDNDASATEHEQAENAKDGACSTLFIANLGPTCSDSELQQALSEFQGFNSIKIRARGGMPVAFADFELVEQATEAMNALQGSSLPSSDRGGMHIEYAKSKMRKP